MSTALQIIVKQANLSPTISEQLLKEFGNCYVKGEDILAESKGISVTSAEQVSVMKYADECRRKLKAVRCEAETVRKRFKDDFLRGGRAIDGIGHAVMGWMIEEENRLNEQATFALRAEAKRKEEMRQARAVLVTEQQGNPENYALGEMNNDEFGSLLDGLRTAKLAREKWAAEEAARAEAERVKRAEEAQALRDENERLQYERYEAEKKAKIERYKRYAEIAAERAARQKQLQAESKSREEAERKAKEAQDALDAARKVEAKRLAAIAAEAKAKADAEAKAVRAPFREKMMAYVTALSAVPMPEPTTDAETLIISSFAVMVCEFADELEQRVKGL